ncbi:MAG: Peptidase C60 family protein [Candidatus Woesebacteria bacterium GW2011_GWA2_44_33]|nr:MAG: Peptidase C60 family protein [Candidatus Woesebacteria bacterium GW2011_GWA2_44_33]
MNSNIRQVKLTSNTLGVSALEKVSGIPIRLKIPTINVNASIQSVGLDQEGAMGVPDSPLDVGWLDLETLSGSVGSAVISGHLNRENGEPGVFADLDKLKVSETIFLEKVNGDEAAYMVSEIHTYDSDYTKDAFGMHEGGRLSLVTCNGVWDKKAKNYNKRLVVTALRAP